MYRLHRDNFQETQTIKLNLCQLRVLVLWWKWSLGWKLTKNSKAIIDCNHDYVTVAGQHGAIIGISRAPFEGLSMDVEEDRIWCLQATISCNFGILIIIHTLIHFMLRRLLCKINTFHSEVYVYFLDVLKYTKCKFIKYY